MAHDAAAAQRRIWAAGDYTVTARQLLPMSVSVETRPFAFRFASEEDAIATFLGTAGPYIRIVEVAATLGRADEALDELRATVADGNEARDGSCVLPGPFLLAVGRR